MYADQLHAAAIRGEFKKALKCLKQGVDVDAADDSGETPLMLASWKGHPDLVELFINRGAKVNHQDLSRSTALHKASKASICTSLIEKHAFKESIDMFGRTPLLVASLSGRADVVDALVSRGASLNVQDNMGRSALHYAVVENHFNIFQALLRGRANPSVIDKYGRTVRSMVEYWRRGPEWLELLKQYEGCNSVLDSEQLKMVQGEELTANKSDIESKNKADPLIRERRRMYETQRSRSYRRIPVKSILFDRTEDGNMVQLGKGGFGVVYRGEYIELGNRKVAIKRIRGSEYGIESNDLENLKKEAETMFSVRHANVATVFGLVIDDSDPKDQLYAIITEYMDYGSLEDLMGKVQIPWAVKVSMLKDVCLGLCYLATPQDDRQYPIVHGDVKTSNILVDMHFNAKISDFGTARLARTTKKSTRRSFQLTISHTAPELLNFEDTEKAPSSTEYSDVWSFGITVFQVCAEKGKTQERCPFPRRCSEHQMIVQIIKAEPLFSPIQMQKIPSDCPPFLPELYKMCCKEQPKDRLTLSEIHSFLQENYKLHCSNEYIHSMINFLETIKNESKSHNYNQTPQGCPGTSKILSHFPAIMAGPRYEVSEVLESKLEKLIIAVTKEIKQTVAMDAGDASSCQITCQNPLLQKFQSEIEANLKFYGEFYDQLISEGIINLNEKKKFEKQLSDVGRTKLLLRLIDSSEESQGKVSKLVDILVNCEVHNNKSLGKIMQKGE